MRAAVCAGAGFLLAVLWFDLMFDVQARGHAANVIPPEIRGSIAAYYARVTTAARPMNRLVAAAMVLTIATLAAEIARADLDRFRAWSSLALAIGAVGLAAGRTVPNAVRLGSQRDDPAQQSRLARMIRRDHVVCIVAIAAVLALQLAPA